ncbi:MAG: amino acid adenylation domain-containing protein [Rhodobacteraceae bacterium]|nr:amino acid adenylation domain-containing protein [Paracoccaceae bacterium]
MNMETILDNLRDHGARVSLQNGQLALSGAKGNLPGTLISQIKAAKPEIIAWLEALEAEKALAKSGITRQQKTVGPLSFSQKRLWVLSQMGGATNEYNVPDVRAFGLDLDVPAIQAALEHLYLRHSVLRSVYRVKDGEPEQVILPIDSAVLALETSTDAALENAIMAEVSAPFDLENGPVMRARLFTTPTRHVLAITLHHIATDGWSMGILQRDLVTFYNAMAAKNSIQPAPLPVQYIDYAYWQNEVQAGSLVQSLSYWQEKLGDAPLVHALPLDYPRPPQARLEGANVSDKLGAEDTVALRSLAKTYGISLFGLLYAAFALFIYRQSGGQGAVIGTPVANRDQPELSDLIGFFVNTVALKTDIHDAMTLHEFLTHARQTVAEALSHQAAPFEMVVDALKPPRSLAYAPLVQLMFTLVSQSGSEPEFAGAMGRPITPDLPVAKFDLSLAIEENADGLRIEWNYACFLFSEKTIAGFAKGYRALLGELLGDTSRIIGDIPLLDTANAAQIIQRGKGPETPLDPRRAEQIFSDMAKRFPDAPALSDAATSLTYKQADERSTDLARHLLASGICSENVVGVAMQRSVDFAVAVLGVLKTGASVALLPVDVPIARVEQMVADTSILCVLTHAQSPDEIQRLPMAKPMAFLAGGPLPLATGANAYVVFTSGTTGAPKGVLNTHIGLVNMCQSQVAEHGFGPESTMTVCANVAFDSILWEMWPSLISGGALHFIDAQALGDPSALAGALQRIQPSHFWLPTGLMETICAIDFAWPKSIHHVFTGGDRLGGYCLPHGVNARLFNLYGPSEASGVTVTNEITPDTPNPAPIGRPLPNVSTYIVDAHNRLLPMGAVGELLIGGPAVGVGYMGRPELNKKVFLPPNEVWSEPVYRSGDLARWREDNTLECLGRIDTQVKIRGFRIEPAEVAAAIQALPGIRQAFVNTSAPYGEKQLVAFVVGDAMHEPEIKAALSAALPSYMLPDAYHFMAALPLTGNGKIDRRALDDVALAAQSGRAVNVDSPRDEIELRLFKIWQNVLLHPSIGLRDNFFEIGGSSISALKVLDLVNKEFGEALATTTLINNPTIEALAAQIRAGTDASLSETDVIEFRKGDGRQNVICIHPGGGTAFVYLSLAKVLPAHFGVYGVQAKGLNEGEAFLPSIPEMASHYIELIRDQLTQDCVITGASFGGFVAYEIARQLHEEGHTNVTAVIMDAMGSDDAIIRDMQHGVTLEVFREKLVKYNGMFPGIDDAQIDRFHRIYNHHIETTKTYACLPDPGHFVLVQALKDRDRATLRYLRAFWQRRAQASYKVRCIAGDHSTMLEGDDVIRIANIIDQTLQEMRP